MAIRPLWRLLVESERLSARAQTVSTLTMVAACRRLDLDKHLSVGIWDLAGMPDDAAYCVVLVRRLQTHMRFNTSASMLQNFEADMSCLLDTCSRSTAMLPLLCGFDAEMKACDRTSDMHKRFPIPFGRLMAPCLACAALHQMHAGAGCANFLLVIDSSDRTRQENPGHSSSDTVTRSQEWTRHIFARPQSDSAPAYVRGLSSCAAGLRHLPLATPRVARSVPGCHKRGQSLHT